MPTLSVLTRDLRVRDNPVLATGQPTVPLFVSDPGVASFWQSPNRTAYLVESLGDLDRTIREHQGSGLLHRAGHWPDVVARVASEVGATSIHIGHDGSQLSQRRARALEERTQIPLVHAQSIAAVPLGSVQTQGGGTYRVFTPFYRNWLTAPRRAESPAPTFAEVDLASDPLPPVPQQTSPQRQKGGERVATALQASWFDRALDYDETRNLLAVDGTSQLSAALHFGTVSPTRLLSQAEAEGASAFARQIAWRDFNLCLLHGMPEAARTDLKPSRISWTDDEAGLSAWSAGRTGFPVIDAAMRQLVATGWMHNRARMLTASFLTKHLRVDWRIGAAFFMQHLTDGDIANNQLGWQWVAGTGTDAQPTRIFNPTLQSLRFDPDGDYIRRWVQELRDVATDEIHDPAPLTRSAVGYPMPVVDHLDAVRTYKELWSGA